MDTEHFKTKIYLSQFWNKSSQHMQASRQCYLPMLWIPNSKKEGVLCSSAVTGTCNPQSLVNFTIMLSKCLVHFATRVFRYTDTLCCHCNPSTSLFNLPITVLSSYRYLYSTGTFSQVLRLDLYNCTCIGTCRKQAGRRKNTGTVVPAHVGQGCSHAQACARLCVSLSVI